MTRKNQVGIGEEKPNQRRARQSIQLAIAAKCHLSLPGSVAQGKWLEKMQYFARQVTIQPEESALSDKNQVLISPIAGIIYMRCPPLIKNMDSKTEYVVTKPLDLQGIIKGIRNDSKLSQADVASRLQIKPGSYCELENNLLPASTSRFLKLLRALDVELVLRVKCPAASDSKKQE